MDCDVAQQLISAAVDGEISAADALRLESHLATCGECRATLEGVREQDAKLLRAFHSRRTAATRVTDQVMTRLAAGRTPRRRSLIVQAAGLLIAAAAGFLIAVLVFEPAWLAPRTEPLESTSAAVARLVLATGGIEVRPAGVADWTSAVDAAVLGRSRPGGGLTEFRCPSSVRTVDDARCELMTSDGCVVRMNRETEVNFRSARFVELRRGQMWCSAPASVPFTVVAFSTPDERPQSADRSYACTLKCPSEASLLTRIQQNGALEVSIADGEVEVETAAGRQRLQPGETVVILRGQLSERTPADDALQATFWTHPLLVLKGHLDEELVSRVNDMLAQMGRTKMSFLYEQELRSLGEYCVLPLLRFVQSPISAHEPEQRRSAVRILADVAPPWAVAELIALLADHDAHVRYHTAGALQRLTGETLGRTPEQWRQPLESCADSYAAWQHWWQKNRDRHLAPAGLPNLSRSRKLAAAEGNAVFGLQPGSKQ